MGCAILHAMNHTLTDWRRAVCGGGRTAQNARRTCAVRVAQSGGGGAFSRKERVRGRFFRVTRDFRLWVASAGRRAVVSRLSTAQKCPCNFAGTNSAPKISPCGVQGQIFQQKFRPAVCRDKFFTKNFALQFCRDRNLASRHANFCRNTKERTKTCPLQRQPS